MHKLVWVLIFTSCLVWSAYHPKDPLTWWLEVLPALVGALLMAITYRRFTFTRLVYFTQLGCSYFSLYEI